MFENSFLMKYMFENSWRRFEGVYYTHGPTLGVLLSLYLQSLVMDEIINSAKNEDIRCMLFGDDIVLIDEISQGVNQKLKSLRALLQRVMIFMISKNKTKICGKFSSHEKNKGEVR